jgi:hypothetical protein
METINDKTPLLLTMINEYFTAYHFYTSHLFFTMEFSNARFTDEQTN